MGLTSLSVSAFLTSNGPSLPLTLPFNRELYKSQSQNGLLS